jgi:hypothetical protein
VSVSCKEDCSSRVFTPSQVVEQLNHRGVYVNERRLRDWWAEGLLPKPVSRGLGRGKGKIFGWYDPDIIQRAADVFELKRRRERFKDAHFLDLFVLGHPIEGPELQAGVLSFLDYVEQCVLHGQSDPDDIEDRLADLSSLVGRKQSSQTGLLRGHLEDLAQEFMLAVFNPAARSDLNLSDLAPTADAWMKLNKPQLQIPDTTPEMLDGLLRRLQSTFSIEELRKFTSTTEEGDFQKAHQIWNSVRKLALKFAEKSSGHNAAELQLFGRRLSLQRVAPY